MRLSVRITNRSGFSESSAVQGACHRLDPYPLSFPVIGVIGRATPRGRAVRPAPPAPGRAARSAATATSSRSASCFSAGAQAVGAADDESDVAPVARASARCCARAGGGQRACRVRRAPPCSSPRGSARDDALGLGLQPAAPTVFAGRCAARRLDFLQLDARIRAACAARIRRNPPSIQAGMRWPTATTRNFIGHAAAGLACGWLRAAALRRLAGAGARLARLRAAAHSSSRL